MPCVRARAGGGGSGARDALPKDVAPLDGARAAALAALDAAAASITALEAADAEDASHASHAAAAAAGLVEAWQKRAADGPGAEAGAEGEEGMQVDGEAEEGAGPEEEGEGEDAAEAAVAEAMAEAGEREGAAGGEAAAGAAPAATEPASTTAAHQPPWIRGGGGRGRQGGGKFHYIDPVVPMTDPAVLQVRFSTCLWLRFVLMFFCVLLSCRNVPTASHTQPCVPPVLTPFPPTMTCPSSPLLTWTPPPSFRPPQPLMDYYGFSADFPLLQQLVGRSMEVAKPKRLYFISK